MSETQDRSMELRGVAMTLWCLATTAIILRGYVRIGMMKAFGVDDYIMIVALLAYTANTTTCVIGTAFGSGRHVADLDPHDAVIAMKFWWACYPSYAVAMIASKFSVGFFLLRIATQKLDRWIIYIAMALTAASGTAFFFVAIFQCDPVPMAWDKTITTGHCLSVDAIIGVTCAYSSIALITDFTFTLLPAWLVLHLQMDKKTKFALIPILSMACIASCAVAVRLAYINDFRNPDFLWATTDIAIWSQTEQGLAIAAGSLATLRPLFRVMLRKIGLSANDTSPSDGRGAHYQNNYNNYKMSQGSNFSHSSGRNTKFGSGRGPRSLWSLATFNRLDDDTGLGKEMGSSTSELNTPVSPNSGTCDSDAGEYRVKIVSKGARGFESPMVRIPPEPHHPQRRESERKLQIHCSREFGSDAV